VLAARYGLSPATETPLRPLEQVRADMLQALQLTAAVQHCTSAYLPQTAVQIEIKVAAILARMEIDGMGMPFSSIAPTHIIQPPCNLLHTARLSCNLSSAAAAFSVSWLLGKFVLTPGIQTCAFESRVQTVHVHLGAP